MPKEFFAYHGTPNSNVRLITAGDRVAYFTDNRNVASEFAFCVGRGGLLSGESATLLHAKIILQRPLVLCDNEWEDIADATNIDKQKLLSQGYDGIVCMNVLEPTYIVAFHEHQFEIIKREKL